MLFIIYLPEIDSQLIRLAFVFVGLFMRQLHYEFSYPRTLLTRHEAAEWRTRCDTHVPQTCGEYDEHSLSLCHSLCNLMPWNDSRKHLLPLLDSCSISLSVPLSLLPSFHLSVALTAAFVKSKHRRKQQKKRQWIRWIYIYIIYNITYSSSAIYKD